MKTLSFLTLLFVSFCSANASADLLMWNLDSADFNVSGSGGLSGSFEYDAAANLYGNINITATGTGSSDGVYTILMSGGATGLDAASSTPLNDGDYFVTLFLSSQMTAAGGTIAIQELTVEQVTSTGSVTVASGSLGGANVTTTVPEPTSLAYMGAAVALAHVRRRRRA